MGPQAGLTDSSRRTEAFKKQVERTKKILINTRLSCWSATEHVNIFLVQDSILIYNQLQHQKRKKKKGRIKICWVTQKSDFYGTSYKILSHQNSISETPGLHKATPDFSYTRRVTVCRRHITLSSFFESKWTSSKQRVTDEAKIMMRMNHSKYGLSTTVRQAWRILYHFL